MPAIEGKLASPATKGSPVSPTLPWVRLYCLYCLCSPLFACLTYFDCLTSDLAALHNQNDRLMAQGVTPVYGSYNTGTGDRDYPWSTIELQGRQGVQDILNSDSRADHIVFPCLVPDVPIFRLS